MKARICLPILLLAATFSLARDKPQNWLQVQSPHFLVITNGNEKQARHAADQFESMRLVFHIQFPNMHVDPASPIVVIALKDEKDFRALEPEDYLGKGKLQLAGLFLRAPDKNYILLRLDAEGDHPYATVYHEYTHLITSKNDAWLPLWLNEGWAEFYQNTEVRNKEASLGEPSPENLMLLRENRLLPLPVLLTVDHTSPYYHEENKGSIFYAEAWVLTHYLTITDAMQHTHMLANYAQLLSHGTDSVTAATQAFGDLQKLQKALEAYVAQNSFNYFKVPAVIQIDESTFKIQPLPSVQADAVRADFLAYNRRAADARSLLEEVLKEDPNNASAHETMGFLEFQEHHLDEARKSYGQAVKLDSQSYLAHYYFAVMTMQSGDSEDDAQVESSLRSAIKLNPEFAPSYDALASFYGRRQRNLEEALALSQKAMQLEPANLGFRLNSANILMALHRTKEAIPLIQSAASVAKNPQEKAMAQEYLQRAQEYQIAEAQTENYNRNLAQAQPNSTQATSAGDASVSSDATPPTLSHRTGTSAAANSSDFTPPRLAPREEPIHGLHRFVTGTIKNVQCTGISAMDFVIVTGAHEIGVHADNYYKIQFFVLGYVPVGDIHPCEQIEGKPAKVEFIEPADKSIKNRIVSIKLHKTELHK
jgi:tetratricopeptide (TPR) repeat protein